MKTLKVLIVEDDPVSRALLEKTLKKARHNVKVAENGEEAIKLVSEAYFDAIITDLMLPGTVDGIGVMEYAKAKHLQTEVIVITAYASVDNAVEAMKKGAADYIEKPINLSELKVRLDRISLMKSLAQDATDLREAIDVAEKNAADTIQDLELRVSGLQNRLTAIKEALSKPEWHDRKRIEQALEIIS